MGEDKSNPKYIIRDTLSGFLTASIIGLTFKYIIHLLGFSWGVIGVFIGFGSLLGLVNGITRTKYHKVRSEKNEMEISFGQIEFTLKRSARQYRILLDNLTDAVYQVNEQGRFVYFNQAMLLLTGYSMADLKTMKIGQIQVKNENVSRKATSILDNNIYRHVEQWKSKDGRMRSVEISTRLIQTTNRMYELNAARDIRPKIDEKPEENVHLREIQHWLYGKINEDAQFLKFFYHQIQLTLTGFSALFNQHLKDIPQQDEQVNKVLTDWKRTRNLLQLFISKNNRDLHSRQSYWDVNEVLLQELSYLKTSMDTHKISIQVQFGSNLVKTKIAGNDLTLAFGVLMRSICHAILDIGGGQLRVVSNMTTDTLFVEFHASPVRNYRNHFMSVLQMTPVDSMMQIPNAREIPRQFFSDMNIQYDPSEEGNKLLVLLRLPFERKVIDQPFKPSARDKGPVPPKQGDYVVL